jgi:NodT family efflux transporter outer membrane factor (OMF) lipoprotein
MKKAVWVVLILIGLASCGSPPKYEKVNVELPSEFGDATLWKLAQPRDHQLKQNWWEELGDVQLNQLEEQALINSPNVKIAAEKVNQARASFNSSSAVLFPQLSLSGRLARIGISEARPLTNDNTPQKSTAQTDILPQMLASYELDLWGRVSSLVAVGEANLESSMADFQNIKLVLSTDIATNYFNLRQADIELDLLSQLIQLQEKAYFLATERFKLGLNSAFENTQLQISLETSRVQIEQLKRTRTIYEHALATLVGQNATNFKISPNLQERKLIHIPVGIPSTLLERRPDIASAERALAAANAQIGIAQAAYYPQIVLGAGFGYESTTIPLLYRATSRIWSFGPNISLPLFDGGRIDANVAFSKSGYAIAVENYKKVVLTAMQEVEDGISGVLALERAWEQANKASKSAYRLFEIALERYKGGVASGFDLALAEQAYINIKRQETQALALRLQVQIFLVKATGGGWSGQKTDGL